MFAFSRGDGFLTGGDIGGSGTVQSPGEGCELGRSGHGVRNILSSSVLLP